MVKRGKKKTKSAVGKNKEMRLLIENNVALQKVLTTLSLDLRGLTKEIGNLLGTFKEASKTLGEERAVEEVEVENKKELIGRLDNLIDQNRTIAKGLILLESTLKEKDKSRNFGF